MKAKELAAALMKNPDLDVMVSDSIGPRDASSPFEYTITEEDAENCGDCEGIVGKLVLVIMLD